jgi:hypothetical protein
MSMGRDRNRIERLLDASELNVQADDGRTRLGDLVECECCHCGEPVKVSRGTQIRHDFFGSVLILCGACLASVRLGCTAG